jgi:hypothetical protein
MIRMVGECGDLSYEARGSQVDMRVVENPSIDIKPKFLLAKSKSNVNTDVEGYSKYLELGSFAQSLQDCVVSLRRGLAFVLRRHCLFRELS